MNARQRAGRAGQAEKALWLRLLLGAPRCVPASRLRPPASPRCPPARRCRQGEAEAARCGVSAVRCGVPGRAAAVQRLGLRAPPGVISVGGCGSAPGGTRSCSSAGSRLKQTPEVQPEPSVRPQHLLGEGCLGKLLGGGRLAKPYCVRLKCGPAGELAL